MSTAIVRPGPTGNATHDAAVIASEGRRQVAVSAAKGNALAVQAAETAHAVTCLKSAIANGLDTQNYIDQLAAAGAVGTHPEMKFRIPNIV